jgi:hypothetical protein
MNSKTLISEEALEQRARRVARRSGLVALKSRWRVDSPENLGGFMIVDPKRNYAVAGPGTTCQLRASLTTAPTTSEREGEGLSDPPTSVSARRFSCPSAGSLKASQGTVA